MDAVILRQSKQLQRKVLTRPGATMGCHSVSSRIQCSVVNDIEGYATYNYHLHSTAEAGGCGFSLG